MIAVDEKVRPHCDATKDWTFRFVRQASRADRSSYGPIALFDVTLKAGRLRLVTTESRVKPDDRDGVSVWNAVDRDGDGVADFVVTAYPCDRHGDPPGRRGRAPAYICVDYWGHHAGGWHLAPPRPVLGVWGQCSDRMDP